MLGTALGLVVSKETLLTSYVFTFAILLTVMTNVCQFYYWRPPPRQDWWGRNGPFVLMCLATVCILVAPLKNLVVNICMASFRVNGFDSTIEQALDIAYMPIFGQKPQQAYTALAYVFMFWSTVLQVDLAGKFTSALQQYRKGRKDTS